MTGSRALGSGPSISRGAAQHEGVAHRLIAVAREASIPYTLEADGTLVVDRQRGRAGGARRCAVRSRGHTAALHAFTIGDLRPARRRAHHRAGVALLPQPPTRRGLDAMTSYSAAEQVLEEGKQYALDIDTSHGPITAVLDTDLGGPIPNSIAFLATKGFYDGLVVPPRRAGLRAAGRLPERHRHRQPRLRGRRHAAALLRVQDRRSRDGQDRRWRPAGASGSQFFVISGKSGESLPPEYGILGHARDDDSLATIKTHRRARPRRRPAQRARADQLDDAARDRVAASNVQASFSGLRRA